MTFTMQGVGPFLHWLTLAILCVMPVLGAFILYKLGGLHGAVAKARNHPQAEAINISGWMGIITLVLWPIAMVWAHMSPVGPAAKRTFAETDTKSFLDKLQQAAQRIAAVEGKLPARSAAKGG